MTFCRRLLELAPLYFNLAEFKDSETRRALLRVQNKSSGKRGVSGKVGRKNRKQK